MGKSETEVRQLSKWKKFILMILQTTAEMLNSARKNLDILYCGTRDAIEKTAKHRENERKAEDWQWKRI